ncbi:MAG: hypothetical protein B6A08_06590 [Sorangiineae bacterium NIC37A_2]|jgi:uncharacterized protein YbaA (DUF1428 family)|nr:MAG: hypothetical protein B6A08_06590 [Sorangiineae bacterium NIC37A_2]
MSYVDFFALPLPKGNEERYRQMAEIFKTVMREHGLLRYCEAVADDVPRGEVTDFYRAVAATEEETVVAAYALWPDKETRDLAWQRGMQDPRFGGPDEFASVFDGKRMFWGGFKPIVEYEAEQAK